MKIDMKSWIEAQLNSDTRVAFPIMTHSGIELTGHTVLEAVSDGEVHAQAVLALAERYPAVASSVIMDLTVEAEAFGAEVHFSQNEVPSIVGRLVSDYASVEALEIPTLSAGRIEQYLRANAIIAATSTKPVIAGCIGPYSLAGRLYDMSELMMALYIEPATAKLLLDKCTQFIISYCEALKSSGVNGVLIAEPAAGLLSADICQEFSSVYVKQIVDRVQDDNFAIFLHNCGNSGHCTSAMVYTGAMGYHFGNSIDMSQALADCPSDVLVMGNIDPVSIIKMASPEDVYATTKELLERTSQHSNFVLSTGCDTPPEVPFANIDAFYKALEDFNNK